MHQNRSCVQVGFGLLLGLGPVWVGSGEPGWPAAGVGWVAGTAGVRPGSGEVEDPGRTAPAVPEPGKAVAEAWPGPAVGEGEAGWGFGVGDAGW
ncbi:MULTISPECIES: hypothetical protein [Kitasatospora]|uniref:Uncharacterized protein n=1 Tax=Kitasatospora cathayae TaxID=3004092 RepID=A0ABY7QC13_9ACTN|nr:hypothetical protein [Kitasatospora sp. HUAS 3-15]WBP90299.1 hypothetical protein O1G21_33535 [Kitasatospora sp. HUAS 3-15]